MIIVGLDSAQFAPVEVQARQKGLRVEGAVFARLFCPDEREQVVTLHLSGNIDFQFLQHGRHQVGKIHQVRHEPGRPCARQMNDERHVQRGVVDEEAMGFFSVLAQALAVIAAENDHGVLIQAFGFEEMNQASHLRIGESDFSVVGTVLVFGRIRGRGMIGIVRIVQVHPEKEFLLIVLAEPVQGHVGHQVAGTLHFFQIRFLQAIEVEVVVVEIESAIQSKARIEHRRADHGAGRISMFLEHGSQGGLARAQFVGGEIVHAAPHGVSSGKHHGVRGQRDRHRSVGALKARAVGGERVDVGSANLLVAVASEMVGAQRVDSDDHHIRRRSRRRECGR